MRLTEFIIKVLVLSLIVSPVMAEEPFLIPAVDLPFPTQTAQAIPTRATPTLAAPYSTDLVPAMPVDTEPTFFSELPATDFSKYWMVSSRHSVQNIHEIQRGPWGLVVQELHCNGTLLNSSTTELSSKLVPGVPVCIFIHGSFVELPNQYVEAAGFYTHVRSRNAAPLQMIFFTWPSDGPYTGCFPADVAVRGRQADFNSFHLAYLISQIPAECPVTLVGHSHGGRVVMATMHLAGGGTVEGHTFPYSMGANRRYRVILAAGALDHHWLNPGQRYECALNSVECVLNLQNREDVALFAYPLIRPFGRRAIARAGLTNHDTRQLGYNSVKLRDVDVTDYVGHKHYWPNYYKSPNVVSTMLPYIYFQ